MDDRHPSIKAMMRKYEATPGLGLRINLSWILDTAEREITDLPVLPDFVNNSRPFVCWAHVIGWCHFWGGGAHLQLRHDPG